MTNVSITGNLTTVVLCNQRLKLYLNKIIKKIKKNYENTQRKVKGHNYLNTMADYYKKVQNKKNLEILI